MVKLLISLAISLFCTKSFSYSMGTHRTITNRAAQEFNFCVSGRRFLPLVPETIDFLTRANLTEDAYIFTKALNWHFYSLDKDLGTGTLGFGHGTMRFRFRKLEERLFNSIQDKSDIEDVESLRSLGKISHFLQDVGNPAHVVPIYHTASDGFDVYDFEKAMPDFISTEHCNYLTKLKFETYFEIMNQFTLRSLKDISSNFMYTREGILNRASWEEAFWSLNHGKNSKQEGFGEYGKFQNNFGVEKFPCYGSDTCQIESKEYEQFARKRIRDSLDATILAFMKYYYSFAH